jgi:hypothetical protein
MKVRDNLRYEYLHALGSNVAALTPGSFSSCWASGERHGCRFQDITLWAALRAL